MDRWLDRLTSVGSIVEFTQIKSIIEAILLTSDAPVTPGKLASLLKDVDGRGIRDAVDALNAEYVESGRAFTIVEVAGGYQMAALREYAPWIREFQRGRIPTKLSQAALETLAIIAFRQPIIRPEIERIRGVNVDSVLRTLMERNLIRITGRSEGVGRPLLYGTTREFLRHFGLKTLSDLPRPEELEDLLRDKEGRSLGDEAE